MRLKTRLHISLSVVLLLLLSSAAYGLFGFCDIPCLMQRYGISRVDRQFEYNEIASDYAFLNTIYPQRLFAGGRDLEDILQIDTQIDKVEEVEDKGSSVAELFNKTDNIADLLTQTSNPIKREQILLNHIYEVKKQILEEIGKLVADVEREAEKRRRSLDAIQQDIERFQKSVDNLYSSSLSSEEYMKIVADNLAHIIEGAAKRNEFYVYIMTLLAKRAQLTHLLGIMTAEKYRGNLYYNMSSNFTRYNNLIFSQ